VCPIQGPNCSRSHPLTHACVSFLKSIITTGNHGLEGPRSRMMCVSAIIHFRDQTMGPGGWVFRAFRRPHTHTQYCVYANWNWNPGWGYRNRCNSTKGVSSLVFFPLFFFSFFCSFLQVPYQNRAKNVRNAAVCEARRKANCLRLSPGPMTPPHRRALLLREPANIAEKPNSYISPLLSSLSAFSGSPVSVIGIVAFPRP
jgi:hypothetical protein